MHHQNTHSESRHPKKRAHIKRKRKTPAVARPEHAPPGERAREPDELLPPDAPGDAELDHDLDTAPAHSDIDDRVR